MTPLRLPEEERILDLLAAQATEGLGPAELHELNTWLAAHPEFDAAGLERAAAALHLGLLDVSLPERLPDPLRSAILRAAPPESPAATLRIHSAPIPMIYRLGWLAAAACLVLAVAGWWRAAQSFAPTAPPSLADRFVQFTINYPDAVRATLAGNTPELGVLRGEVIWSDKAQAGFVKLAGLPANTPARDQYQLWIVDPQRDEKPVDGGVFDVPSAAGDLIVPIHAKLAVRQPKAFAITREKPGGVVVTAGPILALAPVGS